MADNEQGTAITNATDTTVRRTNREVPTLLTILRNEFHYKQTTLTLRLILISSPLMYPHPSHTPNLPTPLFMSVFGVSPIRVHFPLDVHQFVSRFGAEISHERQMTARAFAI